MCMYVFLSGHERTFSGVACACIIGIPGPSPISLALS